MTVLDTTFVADLDAGNAEAEALLATLTASGEILRIPTLVLVEAAASAGKDAEEVMDRLSDAFTLVPLDVAIARTAGKLANALTRKGQFPGWSDVVIGATALHLDEELVTRDERHFRRISGLRIQTY